MTTINPMSERIHECNSAFALAAQLLVTWQQTMIESKTFLTPKRFDDLHQIIEIAKNAEPI